MVPTRNHLRLSDRSPYGRKTQMRRTKVDLSDERLILSHCIADSEFLRKIYEVGSPRLFESQFAQTVASWIWDFFEETGRKEAPGRLVMEIYHKRKSECKDEDELDLVREFLAARSFPLVVLGLKAGTSVTPLADVPRAPRI